MQFNSDDPGDPPGNLENEDILAAMEEMQGYIDITPADFMEVYRFAYNHAMDRIARSMRARDVMTRQVISVYAETPLAETADRMAATGVSGVPVVDTDNTVLGVISEKDFLIKMGAEPAGSFMSVISQCLKNKGCVALPIRGKSAGDIMSAPAISVDPDHPLSEISRLFAEKMINRVPVVDTEEQLTGIVSRADMVHSFFARIC